jgi:VCBS repeat-containing protein
MGTGGQVSRGWRRLALGAVVAVAAASTLGAAGSVGQARPAAAESAKPGPARAAAGKPAAKAAAARAAAGKPASAARPQAGPVRPHAVSPDLIISEFRVRGPNGANDEFVEIYNPAATAVTVASYDVSSGWALAASNGVARFVIPNGTVIPAYGHYLGVNSVGYSLASYPAGNGTTATGDATYTTDIPDNAGIALFRTSNTANFTLANRSDAVGSTSEANTLYKEGTGYPALTPFSIDYSFYRDDDSGAPKDTDVNVADFVFVDTNGTSAGAGQRLGAPGPQNLSAPATSNGGLAVSLLDPSKLDSQAPNFVRDLTSDPANNSTFGTVDLRRTITNNTGANVTRLRFRLPFVQTFPSPSGFADLRPRTSTAVVVSVGGSNRTVQGTTLEQPPSQPNGSGFNGTLSAGTVTLGTPLADGATIDVRWLLGIQQTGTFRFDVNVEALPAGQPIGTAVAFNCATDLGPAGKCPTVPVAVDDSYLVSKDTARTVAAPGVLANDSDADGDTITSVVKTNPSHGALTLNTDGSFTYTPTASYTGPDSFTYQAKDATNSSPAATVTLTVNAPPTANADTYTTAEDTPLNVVAPGVLGNDVGATGTTLSASIVATPTHGTATLNANGSFSYTPTANYSGTDTFTYKANDGAVDSPSPATVTLTVTAVNDLPVATADTYTTPEDTALVVGAPGVLGNDTDADNVTLTAVIGNQPIHGTLTLNANGSFTYTPTANYNGADTFTYDANDGTANSAEQAMVTITVTAVNDPPVATDDAYTATEDTPLTVSAPGVLADDTDVESSALTASVVDGPSHGTLTLNPDGSFTYTPTTDYYGTDTFSYDANDGTADSAEPATVTITVTAVNDLPVAVDDTYTTPEDTPLMVGAPGVLGNDTDVDDEVLTAVLGAAPSHGDLTLNADGSFTYTPTAHYQGSDSFTYTVNDGDASSDSPATVTITVSGVNDAPVAASDTYTTDEDTALHVDAPAVLTNDSDVDSELLTAGNASSPAHGDLTLNADGSFTYTPFENWNGTDSFTYEANDGALDSDPATVTITVTAVDDPPKAPAKHVTVPVSTSSSGGKVTIDIGDLIDNPDGVAFTVVSHTTPAHGTVKCAGTTCTYVADATYTGPDSFDYTIKTAVEDYVTGTVDLTDTATGDGTFPPNQPPSTGAGADQLPDTGAAPGPALRLAGVLLLTGIGLLVLNATVLRRRRLGRTPHSR